MTTDRHQDLWRRRLDEGLDAREEMELWQALEADENLREHALRDHSLDSQLCNLGHIDQTGNEFVLEVMNRLPENRSASESVVKTDSPLATVADPVRPASQRSETSMPLRSATARNTGVNWVVVAAAMGVVCALLLVAVMIAMPGRRSAQPQQQTRNEEVVPQPLERPEGPLMVPGREAPDVPDLASEIGSPETDGKRGEMMVHDPLSDALARPEPAPDPGRIVQELPLTDSTPPELKKVTPPDPDQLVESPESMPSDPVVSPSELLLPVATLVRESDAVWRKRPESWLAGQPVELVSGAIELEMKAGAEVTVQGPARFQLDSPHQVKLTSGHLHAVVPRKAIGFTVQTPASQVVDLGTEFDVTVDDQGATGVQVQRGEVELTSKTAEGQGRQWNLKQGDLKWLAADGEVFDWVLTIRSKGQGSGYVEVNGKRKEYGAEDRGQAMLWISEQCRRLFLKMKPENPLRVMFDVDGQRFKPKTAADMLRAQNAVVRCVVGFADVQERLQELQKTFPNASQFFDFEEMKRSMEQLPARSPLPAKESP